jgi:hypothetical protein
MDYGEKGQIRRLHLVRNQYLRTEEDMRNSKML